MSEDKEPWETEPTEKEWVHEASGYKCYMYRHDSLKHWCGYVDVPKGHPLHGKSYNDEITVPKSIWDRPIEMDKIGIINLFCSAVKDPDEGQMDLVMAFDVHGGLTYAKEREDGAWRFGFDCAHSGDLTPGSRSFGDVIYRDEEYVTAETNSLAKQLFEAKFWNEALTPTPSHEQKAEKMANFSEYRSEMMELSSWLGMGLAPNASAEDLSNRIRAGVDTQVNVTLDQVISAIEEASKDYHNTTYGDIIRAVKGLKRDGKEPTS